MTRPASPPDLVGRGRTRVAVTVHRGTAAYWQLSSTSRVGRVAAPLLAIVVAAVALLAAIVLAVAMLLVGVLVAVALFVRKAVTSGSGGDRDRA